MRGICFDYPQPSPRPHPLRRDVALFVGFVPLRMAGIPVWVVDWLRQSVWLQMPSQAQADLVGIPIPVSSWEAFESLFAWERRLDGLAEVYGQALEETVTVGDDDTLLHILVDGREQVVSLPAATIAVEEFAAWLNSRVEGLVVRIATTDEGRCLVFARPAEEGAGRICIVANVSLGFPRTVKVSSHSADTYVGVAVRTFFQQGGQKCYVLRMGDPLPLNATLEEKLTQLARLLFGDTGAWQGAASLDDVIDGAVPPHASAGTPPEDWRGIQHLLGLDDVSSVSCPDLPELVGVLPPAQESRPYPRIAGEGFVECAEPVGYSPGSRSVRWDVPRCSEKGYRVWAKSLNYLRGFILRHRRDVQLVASLPLPDTGMERDLPGFVETELLTDGAAPISSAFVQLAYPWVKTGPAKGLPGGVVPPEAILIGVLASNALSNGSFISAAGTTIPNSLGIVPKNYEPRVFEAALGERVSLFSRSVGKIALWSDATTSSDPLYRSAPVNRLMALILRAAREYGQAMSFEPSSPSVWGLVENQLRGLLQAVFEAGGLRGKRPDEAFDVVCDGSTMSEQDIEQGRVIAQITFQAAVPIGRIVVELALKQDGRPAFKGVAG